MPARKLSKPNLYESARLYEAGLSIEKVGAYFGLSRQALWARFKTISVKMRPQLKYGAENHFHRGGLDASDRAQNILEEAIKVGIVRRPAMCEKCGASPVFKDGRTGIQGHHCDYNKPLEIMWLCQKCHHEWHKSNKAIPLLDGTTLPTARIVAGKSVEV